MRGKTDWARWICVDDQLIVITYSKISNQKWRTKLGNAKKCMLMKESNKFENVTCIHEH